MAINFFAFSNILTVRLPVPGPISRTVSVGLRSAFCSSSGIVSPVSREKQREVEDTYGDDGVCDTGVLEDMLTDVRLGEREREESQRGSSGSSGP